MPTILPVKNVTTWVPAQGQGYITGSGSPNLLTQSGKNLLTQSGSTIILNPNIYNPKSITGWSKTGKTVTSWYSLGGEGYTNNQGILDFTDNHGNFIVDNHGNNIVTTPSYVQGKNVTTWTLTGA